jgi:hypothetical protein
MTADWRRLNISRCHRNPRNRIPSMEVAKKEGCCRAKVRILMDHREAVTDTKQRDAIVPHRLHRYFNLRDLQYRRLPAQLYRAHCTLEVKQHRRGISDNCVGFCCHSRRRHHSDFLDTNAKRRCRLPTPR